MIIEIPVFNIETAIAALEAGADRLELCSDSASGGTTPSYGMVKEIRSMTNKALMCMIRPRGGDFLYTQVEFGVMKKEIEAFAPLGVEGFVFGILDQNGSVDRERCDELIRSCKGFSTTFHRAFDVCRSPEDSLEEIIALGFDRLLSSGRADKAFEGIALIKKLVKQADERIDIMAGAGINEENVGQLVEETGVRSIHFSAKTFRKSQMNNRGGGPHSLGSGDRPEGLIEYLDMGMVKRIRDEFPR